MLYYLDYYFGGHPTKLKTISIQGFLIAKKQITHFGLNFENVL